MALVYVRDISGVSGHGFLLDDLLFGLASVRYSGLREGSGILIVLWDLAGLDGECLLLILWLGADFFFFFFFSLPRHGCCAPYVCCDLPSSSLRRAFNVHRHFIVSMYLILHF